MLVALVLVPDNDPNELGLRLKEGRRNIPEAGLSEGRSIFAVNGELSVGASMAIAGGGGLGVEFVLFE